jgi:hypothetical protein
LTRIVGTIEISHKSDDLIDFQESVKYAIVDLILQAEIPVAERDEWWMRDRRAQEDRIEEEQEQKDSNYSSEIDKLIEMSKSTDETILAKANEKIGSDEQAMLVLKSHIMFDPAIDQEMKNLTLERLARYADDLKLAAWCRIPAFVSIEGYVSVVLSSGRLIFPAMFDPQQLKRYLKTSLDSLKNEVIVSNAVKLEEYFSDLARAVAKFKAKTGIKISCGVSPVEEADTLELMMTPNYMDLFQDRVLRGYTIIFGPEHEFDFKKRIIQIPHLPELKLLAKFVATVKEQALPRYRNEEVRLRMSEAIISAWKVLPTKNVEISDDFKKLPKWEEKALQAFKSIEQDYECLRTIPVDIRRVTLVIDLDYDIVSTTESIHVPYTHSKEKFEVFMKAYRKMKVTEKKLEESLEQLMNRE